MKVCVAICVPYIISWSKWKHVRPVGIGVAALTLLSIVLMKDKTMMANIKKTRNPLSPQLIKHKNDHNISRWKSKSRLGTATKMWRWKLLTRS